MTSETPPPGSTVSENPPAPPPALTPFPPLFCTVGRYAVYDELAAGGMATIHLGRLHGAAGFSRIVAIKRLHARFVRDRDFVAMFTDEARVASRIRHPNVVSILDVVADENELFLVMEYVHGETLSRLVNAARRRGQPVPPAIASAILADALRGLHEAHEARDEQGKPLGVVHRDFSPQNILIGADGAARVLDFGVAKAAGQLHVTSDGSIKGKLAYMPPEQLLNEDLDRRVDIYAAGVVLWEALTGRRLFSSRGDDLSTRILQQDVLSPGSLVDDIPPGLDRAVMRAVQHDRGRRFETAADMVRALENSIDLASPAKVGAWVRDLAGDILETRSRLVGRIEALGEEPHAPATSLGALPAASPSRPVSDSILTVPAVPAARATPQPAAVRSTDTIQVTTSEIPPHPAPPRRSRWIVVGSLGLLLTAAGVSKLVSSDDPAPSPLSPSSSSLSSPAPSATPVDPTPSAAPTPSAPVARAPASAPASTPASTRPSAPTPGGAKVVAPRAPPRPADCNPPFVITETGEKRYKKECFRR